MLRTRPNIAQQDAPVRKKFTLDIDIPIQHISASRILLHVAISDIVWIEADVRIDAGPQLSIVIETNNLVGRGGGSVETELVRKRQNVKDAKAAADGGLLVFERVPGKAQTRLEVFRR